MPLWNELEGSRIAERFPLQTLLRSEGRTAWFTTEMPGGGAAILSLSEAMNDDDALLGRLRAASELRHANLLAIREAGKTSLDDTPLVYALMEPYDQSLPDVLRERPLEKEEADEVAEAMLLGLEAIHGAGLTHGHVEPASVLAVGDTVKLRTDCLQQNRTDYARREDVRGLAATLYQAMTLRSAVSGDAIAALPSPFASIIRNGLGGQWTLGDVRRALKGPTVESARGAVATGAAATPANAPTAKPVPAATPASPASNAASERVPAQPTSPGAPVQDRPELARPDVVRPEAASDGAGRDLTPDRTPDGGRPTPELSAGAYDGPAAAFAAESESPGSAAGEQAHEALVNEPVRPATELDAERAASAGPASRGLENATAGAPGDFRASQGPAATRSAASGPAAVVDTGIAATGRKRPGMTRVALVVLAALVILLWWVFHRRPAPTTLTGEPPAAAPAVSNSGSTASSNGNANGAGPSRTTDRARVLPGGRTSVQPAEAVGQAMGEPGATPAAREHSKPSAAAPATGAAAGRGVWHVIAYTFSSRDRAQAEADRLAGKYPALRPQVFTATGGAPYFVALGSGMTRAEAFALRDKARASGLPHDTYAQNYSK